MIVVERFWRPRDAPLPLDPLGYLIERPDLVPAIDSGPAVYTTDQLALQRCVVLLGEPGAGKTTVLLQSGPLLHDRVPAQTFDLAEYGSEDRIVHEILEHAAIERWLTSQEQLCIVFDGLDEAMARVTNLATLLARRIQKWDTDRLYLRIACRTADFPETLLSALKAKYGHVTVVEILPLRRQDAGAIVDGECDAEALLDAADACGASPLAARPLTLRLLASVFRETGSLPDRAADLFDQGIRTLLDEPNEERFDGRLAGQLSLEERLSVARRVAAATVFGGRPAVWIGRSSAASGDDVALDVLAQGTEPSPNDSVSVSVAALREVMRTGLFGARGGHRLGWIHVALADYLAASWVVENGLSQRQARALFFSPEGRSWPQTRLAGAWTAAIDPDLFGWVAVEDPESFGGEVALPGDELRAAVVTALLRTAERIGFALSGKYAGLAHTGLADQLRRALTDGGIAERQLAVQIARDCKVIDLLSDLVALVRNPTADIADRVSAGWIIALFKRDAPTAGLRMLALGTEDRRDDPLDELKGVALMASWPHALSATEVFSVLTQPQRSNYHGAYEHFLLEFSQSLGPDDVEAAVSWLASIDSQSIDHRLALVANSAIRLVAATPEVPGAVEALARVAISRCKHHDGNGLIYEEYENGADPMWNRDLRRRVASAVLDMTNETRVLYRLSDRTPYGLGLVRAEDFSDLITAYADADDVRRVALLQVVRWTFDLHCRDHVNLVLELAPDHPLMTDFFAEWIDPIELNSPKAQELRDALHAPVGPPPSVVEDGQNIADQVISLLDLPGHGVNSGFWRACLVLSIGPNGVFLLPNPDLTMTPRWSALSAEEQARFVVAAEAYLRHGAWRPDGWNGDPDNLHPARAGYQALLLLLRRAPECIDKLPAEVWREWAPIIVGWHCEVNGSSWEDKLVLLTKADLVAHDALRSALCRAADAAVESDTPLFGDKEIAFLWDETINAHFMALARSAQGSARATLVEAIARNQFQDLRPVLVEWMRSAATDRDRAILAGRVVVDRDLEASWDLLESNLDTDASLVEAVLGSSQTVRFWPGRRGLEVPEQLIGRIYLRLRSAFPSPPDLGVPESALVDDRRAIVMWRDTLLAYLQAAGTPEAVRALREISTALPSERWLQRVVAQAEVAMNKAEWTPTPVPQLLRLASTRRSVLVHGLAELAGLLTDALEDIQERLIGAQPESHQLWDTRSRRPKVEDEISDYLANKLRDIVGGRAIVVNREVEVRRSVPTGIGERTDLQVDAVAGDEASILTLPIEVKGAWNPRLPTALQDQLVSRYMQDLGVSYGLYVVAWPDLDFWDVEDDDRARVAGLDAAEVRAALEKQARELRSVGIEVGIIFLRMDYRRPQPVRRPPSSTLRQDNP